MKASQRLFDKQPQCQCPPFFKGFMLFQRPHHGVGPRSPPFPTTNTKERLSPHLDSRCQYKTKDARADTSAAAKSGFLIGEMMKTV